MIEALANGILLLGLVFGTIVDLKTREVPDWLNYALIATGVSAGVALSIAQSSIFPLIFSIAGLIVGMAVGYAMYYGGQWGGGDTKLFMGMGSILGISFTIAFPEQPLLSILIWWIIAGAIYGLAWSIGLAIKHRAKVMPAYRKTLKESKRRRLVIQILTVLLLVAAVFTDTPLRVIFVIAAACAFGLFHIHLFVKCIEKTAMNVPVPVAKLTEGDWLLEPVRVKGKTVVSPRSIGLTLADIDKLKKQTPNAKPIIRIGIPFIPVFLLAYVLLLIAGNPLTLFL